ncbi:sensor histidine kinase [Chromobacterium sp. IIBBL 290-4]|uniref:sensor histidine kinase n=1 Tax=Chromobacterium sp. IIBBL 290-4 TaxID=2953890 RepID=UPI0020B84293|nr:sensor histidine kinase [Chromobacterium sp. IIBBL 290-4]UTH75740.1 sensor histidine kinase [Chromobacterium sp. IIBBL 290-4]
MAPADARPSTLPDFRNQGIMLRVLLLPLLLLFASGLQALASPDPWWRWLQTAMALLPGSLLTLAALAWLSPWLARRSRGPLWVAGLTGLCFGLCQWRLSLDGRLGWPTPALAMLAALLLLHYLALRQRALSPALAEARLTALQARIRPHFLFNSLNAAIALIRAQPQKAETVLEDLAELFRAQMAEPDRASTLAREIELAKMYLAIETERLGPRLKVVWRIDAPLDALLPPLILQPLAENAVCHGAERMPGEAEIVIAARLKAGLLELTLDNPAPPGAGREGGSGMALSNLRERLALFFDAEASMETAEEYGRHLTRVRLPYRRDTR